MEAGVEPDVGTIGFDDTFIDTAGTRAIGFGGIGTYASGRYTLRHKGEDWIRPD
jgi:hypothetical protein